MKKISVFIIALLLNSCALVLPSCTVDVSKETFDLGTPTEALDWIATHIQYKSDIDNYWQTPSETLSLKTGDCEDFAILFLSALKAQGIDAKIVGIKVDWYQAPSTNLHAIVEWNEQWYTVERGNAGGLPIGIYPKLWEMGFVEALQKAKEINGVRNLR